MSSRTNVAAGPGFETGQTDPKSVVLPLHNPASLHLPLEHYSMVASGWQLNVGCAPLACIPSSNAFLLSIVSACAAGGRVRRHPGPQRYAIRLRGARQGAGVG